MKHKIFPIIGAVAAIGAISLTGCSEEQTLPVGEASMFLSTRVNSDVTVESRAADDLAASTIVWISNAEGVVRKYNSMDEIPAGGVKLLSGDYTIKAWAGKLEYASFESRWFEGQESVTLSAGDRKSVEVVCKIANVVTSVKYGEGIATLIENPQLTVSHKGGSLAFDGGFDETRKGYFMMPEGVTALDYVFTATFEGSPVEVRGTIDNVEPAHEYVLNIYSKNQGAPTEGAAFITIDVDDTMVEITDEIVITTPPSITGYGFDITMPVAGEKGSIGRKSVYVCAASEVTSLALSGIEGHDDIDLMQATAEVLARYRADGIYHEIEAADGGQMVKVVFDETYVNSLENRDDVPYVVTITATDSSKKTASARLQFRVSEAPVITSAVPEADIDITSITLSGQVSKDNLESVGFEYRVKGTPDWIYIAGSTSRSALMKGQTFSATITGLAPCTTVEYCAVNGTAENPVTFRGEIMEATTADGPQLPFADMETWFADSDKAAIPGTGADTQFWDNGNHGSQTMSKNVTESSSAYKHSGSKSAELHSQFVGLGSIGKFAAGNLFVGKYIATDGTDGIIGFGRDLPFEIPAGLKIKSLKVWVKYIPQPVSNQKEVVAGSPLQLNDPDQGHIFIALFDDYDTGDSDANNRGKYGYVVRTKKQDNVPTRLFDRNASNVCAYGEHVFTEATPGNDMVEIEIPLEYVAGKGAPKIITIVNTASKYGDYFSGGRGTKMYVDDFRLVYEAI